MSRITKLVLYPAAGLVPIVAGASDSLLDYAHAYPTVTHKLGEASALTFKLKSESPWEGVVKSRQRIKALYDDGSFQEWRIREVRSTSAGFDGVVVRAEPIWTDLADRRMKRVLEPNQTVSLAMTLMDLYTEEVLSAILSTEYGCDARFAPGTVPTAYQTETPVVQGVDITHLEALRQLCEQLSCEWDIRWDGAVYRIDLVSTIGDTNPAARLIEAPTGGAAASEGNRVSLEITDSGDAYFNRLIPLCGDREFPTTIAGAEWIPDVASYLNGETRLRLTLKPYPMVKDHTLVGLKIGNAEQGYFPITKSLYPNWVYVTGNAGSLIYKRVRFLAADGAELVGLDVPGEGGDVEISEYFDDIPQDSNLFEEYGGSADMSTGASRPLGTNLLGAATTEMVSTPLYVAYGKKSVKVTAPAAGDGLETVGIAMAPTQEKPYYSFWARVQVESGRVGMYMVDDNAQLYPPEGVINYGGKEPAELTAQGIEPMAGPATFRIVALEAGTVFYVDALTITQSNVPVPYSAKMGPRALFEAGARRLAQMGGQSTLSYEGEFFDASIIKGSGSEVRLGDAVTVRDRYRDGEWKVSFTARVVELEETENPTTGRVQKRVKLERRPLDAAARFVERPALPAAPTAPDKDSNVVNLDGLNVLVSIDQVAIVGEDVNGTVTQIPLLEPLRVDLRDGTELIIAGQIQASGAVSDHQYIVSKENQQGVMTLEIERQFVKAKAGQAIRLDHASLISYLYVRPGEIQLGVEEERKERGITSLTVDAVGLVDQLQIEPLQDRIPQDAVLNLVHPQSGRVQHAVVTRDHALGEEILDIYERELSMPTGAGVDLAGYYIGSQLTMHRDEIELKVSSDTARATWEASGEAKAFAVTILPSNHSTTLNVSALPAALPAGAHLVLYYFQAPTGPGMPMFRTKAVIVATGANLAATQITLTEAVTVPAGAYVFVSDGEMLVQFKQAEAAVQVLEDQVTQHASSITSLDNNIDDLWVDVSDIEDDIDDLEDEDYYLDTRITSAEGRITTTESAIDQRVTKATFNASMLGGPVGKTKVDYNGLRDSIALNPFMEGDVGAAYTMKKNQVILIVDVNGRSASYARLKADVAYNATALSIEDPKLPGTNAMIYAKAGSTVYAFTSEPEIERTSLNLSLDGIKVEAKLFKSTNWNGTVDANGQITASGTTGWCLTGTGNADITGTLRAAGGDVVVGTTGIVIAAGTGNTNKIRWGTGVDIYGNASGLLRLAATDDIALVPGIGKVVRTNAIETSAGNAYWHKGTVDFTKHTAGNGTVTNNCHVAITIGGTVYYINARTP